MMRLTRSVVTGVIITGMATILLYPGSATVDDLGAQATQLRQKIQEREAEIKRLQSRREELERTARLQSRELRQFEIQFRHYLANLENSQKRAQGLEKDLLMLVERAHRRMALLEMFAFLSSHNPGPVNEQLRQAAISGVVYLCQDEIRESQQRRDLEKKIDAELAYQQRIRNRYMANDRIRRKKVERRLALAQDQAKANLEAERRIAAELEELRRRLKTLDEQLARLRAKDLEKQSSGRPVQAPFQPGRPFIQLRGRLPWPAPGRVVRGYGPFTHPTLGVKLESKGIDVAVAPGTVVKAVADGRVVYVGALEHYGSLIALDHGGGFYSVYGNVEASGLKIGQVVQAGAYLGVVSQKNSEGDSIYHFEVRHNDRALDPAVWLAR